MKFLIALIGLSFRRGSYRQVERRGWRSPLLDALYRSHIGLFCRSRPGVGSGDAGARRCRRQGRCRCGGIDRGSQGGGLYG